MFVWDFTRAFRGRIHVVSASLPQRLAVRHALSWSETVAAHYRHEAKWDDWIIKRRHVAPYSSLISASHEIRYSEMVASRHESKWSLIIASRMVAAYSQLAMNAARNVLPWNLTAPNAAINSAAYSLLALNPAALRHDARWDIRDSTAQIVLATVTLTYGSKQLVVSEASVSCDEQSPIWIGNIALTDIEDYNLLQPGALVTLAMAGETFSLVVDSKQLTRSGPASSAYSISVSSPLSLKDSPFAATINKAWETTVTAKAAVEEMLGPVTWSLLDWSIPAGSATFSDATPLEIARNIVAAIGGIIESNPDGSIVCRPRHYYSPPNYNDAPAALVLADDDIIESMERQSVVKVTNRLTISNELAAASATDRIEYEQDESDDNAGTVRAYPEPWRDLDLVHTGDITVDISDLGEEVSTHEEIIQITAGAGSTQYPVLDVLEYDWRYTDLGAITVAGQSVRPSIAGYSLLYIKYRVRAQAWAVSNSKDEDVLFLAMEA